MELCSIVAAAVETVFMQVRITVMSLWMPESAANGLKPDSMRSD